MAQEYRVPRGGVAEGDLNLFHGRVLANLPPGASLQLRGEEVVIHAETPLLPADLQAVEAEASAWDAAARAAEEGKLQAQREAAEFDDRKLLQALALWAAGKLGVPAAQAREEILAIFRTL